MRKGNLSLGLTNHLVLLYVFELRWDKQQSKDWEYYTLEALLYFVNNLSESHPGYVQKASFQGVKAVKRPDRKALLNYVKGDEGQFTL